MKSTTAKPSILIVEDEAVIAKDIEHTIRGLGYAAASVGTGRRAVEKAGELRPDLILMDIRLEGEPDGIDAAQEIRRRFDIPVVYLTAYADDHTLKRARATEPFGYIVKPFTDRELRIAVEVALLRYGLEKRLHQSEEWLTTTLHCIGDAVITVDEGQRVTFLNPAAEGLTGRRRKEALGRALPQVFSAVDEKTRRPWECPLSESLHEGRPATASAHHCLLISKRGSETPVEVNAWPIRGRNGHPLGAALVFRDVSERRQMEQKILGKQKMEAIGKLAGSIAHEFSNLLGAMSGQASAIVEKILPNTSAYNDALKLMDSVRHAHDLTRRILSVAQASGAEEPLKLESVDLAETVASTVALVEKPFAAQKVVVRFARRGEPPRVRASRSQLLDVLMDLFLNAAEAMPKGGTLTVTCTERTARHPDAALPLAAKPRRYVLLRIADTGIGMPKSVLGHLFEPFFTTKGARGSIGFGLSVVQSAVQQWGGWIKVASRPGRGTTFTIFIPKGRKSRPAPAAPAVEIPKGTTVLLVDDKPECLQEIRSLLEKDGVRTIPAQTSAEALALYRKHAPEIDLVIADAILPGTNGKKLLDEIMALDPAANVIMTCGFSRDYVRSVLSPGAWSFIQKPFDREQLLGVMRRALSQKSA